MDYRSLVNKLEAIQRGTVAEATAPIVNPYKDPAQAAKFDAMTDADKAWLTKGGGVPDINDEIILSRAPNKGQPDPNKARANATKTSNEFIKKRLGQLKNLVARIRSGKNGAPAQSGKPTSRPDGPLPGGGYHVNISGVGNSTGPKERGWDAPGVKESLRKSLSNILKEEFGYDLSEKVTLGTGPVVQQDIGNGMTISVGQYQKEVALIRKIMAELADIDDPAVIAALQDAQAALDELAKGSSAGGSGDKEKDRARMKELIAITKKPPVSDSDLEESRRPKSLSESMGAIRNKLLLLEAPLPVPAGAGRNAIAVRPNLPAKRPGGRDDPNVIDGEFRVIPDKPGMSMGQKLAVGTGAIGTGAIGVNALNREKPAAQTSTPTTGQNARDDLLARGSVDKGPTTAAAPKDTANKPTTSSTAQRVSPDQADRDDAELGQAMTAQRVSPDQADRDDAELGKAMAANASSAPAQSGKEAPAGSDYTIVKGDNLTKISKKFGVSIQDIMKANPYIKDPNLIYAGKTLKIPGSGSGTPAASSGGSGTPAASSGGFGKTNLTKFYANEMGELETLIGKYANDPEMADDVKAAQAQLAALKATGQ